MTSSNAKYAAMFNANLTVSLFENCENNFFLPSANALDRAKASSQNKAGKKAYA
jgi:hypothetical protein